MAIAVAPAAPRKRRRGLLTGLRDDIWAIRLRVVEV
jgi:hypothetical protein